MPLNKNRDNNYIGFEDVIESQEHSNDFKSIVKKVKLRKSMLKKDNKAKTLNDTSLFKYAKLYEINNGSGYSVLEENLTNYNISTQAKNLTDLVTYVATKEFDDINLYKFHRFLKQCSKCIKEIQVHNLNENSNNKKLNAKAVEFKNTYPEDVYTVASTANNLVGNVANNADKILKLYKGKNRIIFTPENYVVYNLSTVDDSKLQNEYLVQDSVVISRIQQAYASMFKEKLTLERIPTLNKKINKFHLNDALLIDSNFDVNELPNVFMTIQSQTANKRTNFLTDMNRNKFALMKNTDLPLTIVRFPDKKYFKTTNMDLPIDYSHQKELIFNNLNKKYPNTIISFSQIKTDKFYTGYSYENGTISVKINSAKTYENESSTPKDIINAIFQAERANNEVTIDDINKTLLLTRKLSVNGRQNIEEKIRFASHNKLSYKHSIVVKEKDLLIKDNEIKEFFKQHNITSYESLMQRAIALGATMNSLKLNNVIDPQGVKATNLFLESQFNKTITLLSSLDKNWVLPYITEKIAQSFELEVSKLELTKQDVLDRFERNGMPVNADTSCTLRQIAFAKPKYQDILKRVKDADDLNKILDDVLNGKKIDNISETLKQNSDYENQRYLFEEVLDEIEEERQAAEREQQNKNNQTYPLVPVSEVKTEKVKELQQEIAEQKEAIRELNRQNRNKEVETPDVIELGTEYQEEQTLEVPVIENHVKEEKPLQELDVVKMLKKVFEKEQAKVEKKIFDKSEHVSNEKLKEKYNSAYVLSSTILDLYDDILNKEEMRKNDIKRDSLADKENLTEDERVLKIALDYNDGYSTITHLIANSIYKDTLEIAEKTGRKDKTKIARTLVNSLSKTINIMFARDYEKICDINIIRKNASEISYTDVLKTKAQQIINESEK